MPKCYIDGGECTCGAWDVASECPKDDYFHDEDEDDAEDLDTLYPFGDND